MARARAGMRAFPCHALLRLVSVAVPLVIQQAALLFLSVATVARVGQTLGAEALAGFSLGNLSYNLLGLTLVMAPMVALDTYAPQSYGAGRLREVGLGTQRAVVVAALILAPAAGCWMVAEPIMLSLGQTAEVARVASRFLRGMLPVLPIQVVFEAAKRFLFAQGILWPSVLSALLGVAVHAAAVGPLVASYGFDGAVYSLLLAHGSLTAALLLYVRLRAPHAEGTWPGIAPRLLLADPRAMRAFCRTALHGLLTVSEWVFWEVICFRAGVFGSQSLAVHAVAYNVIPITFMMPFGLSIAVSNGVRREIAVGIYLGEVDLGRRALLS